MQRMIDKTPLVARDTFAVAEKLMRSAMPKFQALARKCAAVAAAKRAAAGSVR